MNVENEILTKKIQNLEMTLLECQNRENAAAEVNSTVSDTLIDDLLSEN